MGFVLAAFAFSTSARAQIEASDYISPVDPVTNYYDAIERVETDGGSYASDLSDLYLGLGRSLVQNGSFDEARDAFHQGVLIVRVNAGPNSLEQTNYLFSIADIETRLGDLKAASAVMENIYLINAKNHGEDSPDMLPVLEQMYDWYVRQRPLYSPYVQYSDFQKSKYLATRMAILTERGKGLGHPDTAQINRTLGQIHFLTVRYVLSQGISIEPGVVMSTGTPQPPHIQEVSVRDHFREGTEAFGRVVQSVAANESSTAMEYAEALAQFGDWYLVFERYQSAHEMYEQAYHVLLANNESSEVADDYFGNPTPVRFMNNHQEFMVEDPLEAYKSEPEPEPDDGEKLDLDVSMTVMRSGDVRSIEILNAPDWMSESQIREVQRQLDETRFRPGLVNGEAVKLKDYVWSYSFESSGGIE